MAQIAVLPKDTFALASPILSLVVPNTEGCNLSCAFCYINDRSETKLESQLNEALFQNRFLSPDSPSLRSSVPHELLVTGQPGKWQTAVNKIKALSLLDWLTKQRFAKEKRKKKFDPNKISKTIQEFSIWLIRARNKGELYRRQIRKISRIAKRNASRYCLEQFFCPAFTQLSQSDFGRALFDVVDHSAKNELMNRSTGPAVLQIALPYFAWVTNREESRGRSRADHLAHQRGRWPDRRREITSPATFRNNSQLKKPRRCRAFDWPDSNQTGGGGHSLCPSTRRQVPV